MELIDKSALVVEIEKLISNAQIKLQESQENNDQVSYIAWAEHIATCIKILSFLDTLEVIDPYEECVQYASIKAGIQAHAETYSFNIESKLFNQLTKEQQELWRKEIEQACISGGEVGVELAKDPRYKENVEVKEVDCDENMDKERGKELALSLQIQAYLNTAGDELYAKGKPLYSKSHLEGIHMCMKMWAKLHDYYFYKNTCENKEVDLEKEIDDYLLPITAQDVKEEPFTQLEKCAKHFFELGLKAHKGK